MCFFLSFPFSTFRFPLAECLIYNTFFHHCQPVGAQAGSLVCKKSSPPYEGGVAAAFFSADGVVLYAQAHYYFATFFDCDFSGMGIL
jgi:hypothetical protein